MDENEAVRDRLTVFTVAHCINKDSELCNFTAYNFQNCFMFLYTIQKDFLSAEQTVQTVQSIECTVYLYPHRLIFIPVKY